MKYIVQLYSFYLFPTNQMVNISSTMLLMQIKSAAKDTFAKQFCFKYDTKIYKYTGLGWPQNSI